MTLSTTIDAQVVSGDGISFNAKAFAAEVLGPMPGKWDGYGWLDESIQKEIWSKVGYIHGVSAEAGRNVVSIGQALKEMKEVLPHGQFMDCVKAEFGWSQRWCNQLMQVAERFSNWNSSSNLPSSAKVLALLAENNATDDVVAQAAQERWTVKEVRSRVRGVKEKQRTIIDEALSALKLSVEARELALKAEHITTRQFMDEMNLDEIPKGKRHQNTSHVFCKNGTGWWKLPVQSQEVAPLIANENRPLDAEVLPMAVAAQRLNKKLSSFRVRMSPGEIAKRGFPSNGQWQAEPHPARGMCLVRQIS